jgi:hypothetical protein
MEAGARVAGSATRCAKTLMPAADEQAADLKLDSYTAQPRKCRQMGGASGRCVGVAVSLVPGRGLEHRRLKLTPFRRAARHLICARRQRRAWSTNPRFGRAEYHCWQPIAAARHSHPIPLTEHHRRPRGAEHDVPTGSDVVVTIVLDAVSTNGQTIGSLAVQTPAGGTTLGIEAEGLVGRSADYVAQIFRSVSS